MPPKNTPSSVPKNQTSLFSFFQKTPQAATPSSAAKKDEDNKTDNKADNKSSVVPSTPRSAAIVPVRLAATPAPEEVPAPHNAVTQQKTPSQQATPSSSSSLAAKRAPQQDKDKDADADALVDSDEDEQALPSKRQRLLRTASTNKNDSKRGSSNKKKKRNLLESEDEEWRSDDNGNDNNNNDDDEESFVNEEDSEEDDNASDGFIVSDEDDEDNNYGKKKKRKQSSSSAASASAARKKSLSLPPRPAKAPSNSNNAKKYALVMDSPSPGNNNKTAAARDTTARLFLPPTPGSARSEKSRADSVSERDADNDNDSVSSANNNSNNNNNKSHALLPEGVVGPGSHEHNSLHFLFAPHRRDAQGRAPTHPEYNLRTLQLPAAFVKEQTPAMAQWWQFKAQNMDTVLFFKVGKFYELFHMDADIGYAELDLIYMKGHRAHSGFPEVAYGKNASILVSKGYRVARIEQMETPEMLKDRNDSLGRGQKDKVVKREVCSVMSKGTRTYCHLDDLSLLEESDTSAVSSSLLLCIKERVLEPSDESVDAEGESTACCEYGLCAVDPVLGAVTLAQFADDAQRSRLRAFLSRFPATEVLLERDPACESESESERERCEAAAALTRSAVSLVVPRALVETLSRGEMPRTGRETVRALRKGLYFGKEDSSTNNNSNKEGEEERENAFLSSPPAHWPPVLRAVLAGLCDASSELVCVALGGALWQLRRSLIDYEVLSLGRVFAYVPPDEERETPTHTVSKTTGESEKDMLESEAASECATDAHAQTQKRKAESLSSLSSLHGLPSASSSLDNDLTLRGEETDSPNTHTEADPHKGKRLVLDAAALSQLDILCCADGSLKGSLWAFVNRARSASGRRLLRQWLCQPLFSAREIHTRQCAVQELLSCFSSVAESSDAEHTNSLSFTASPSLVSAVEGSRAKLKSLPDLDRLLSRVHSNGLRREREPVLFEASTYSARQIRDFADTLSGLETIAQMVEAFQSASVRSPLLQRVLYALPREKDRIPQEVKASTQTKTEKDRAGQFPLHSLRALLSHFRGIFDEKQARKEGTITPRPGVSEEYDAAMEALQEILSSFTQHLEEMKRSCGVHDLKYFGNGKDRYQIEVPVAYINKLPSNWVSKSTKKTHRRYWTPFLERQVQRLIQAEEAVKACQKDTLRCLFAKFDEFRDVFERVSQCVAVYDALLSLSEVSSQPQYCWPQFVHREQSHSHTDADRAVAQLKIVGGRHPTVEQLLQERGEGDFIPNDVLLGGTTTLSVAEREEEFLPRMLLLTGPNMGGKSTLLRQTCLLVILAQLGCKVPAEECVLSPVDRIFTRVGASDRILAGQSTFFVELAETSLILRHATEDSLCILDELGRGTATFDGTAIAHSVVEYLVSRVRCRALFATHYHLLVQDWEIDPRVRLGHMDCFVQESESDAAGEKEEDVTFLYKLCDGASPKSYGINVARLAGLPASLIRLAAQQSQRFEEKTNRKRFRHSQGLREGEGEQQEEQEEGERVAQVYSQAHKVFTVFERLVSIAHAELSLQELAFVAREIWRRCETMGL